MCVGSLAGVTYLRYTVLTSSNKSETAVHCCDPALSVLVMLVSGNVFHVVSALQSIVFSWDAYFKMASCKTTASSKKKGKTKLTWTDRDTDVFAEVILDPQYRGSDHTIGWATVL